MTQAPGPKAKTTSTTRKAPTKPTSSQPKQKRSRAETSHPNHERICNLVPSTETEKDWQFEDAVASGALEAVAAPPAKVDWPAHRVMAPALAKEVPAGTHTSESSR